MIDTANNTKLKRYCVTELSQMYQVDRKTFRRWLIPFNNELGKREGKYFNVLQVEIIFNRLGNPLKVYQIDP